MVPSERASVVIYGVVGDDQAVILRVASLEEGACCPTCGVWTDAVHDRYVRRPLDLPWRGATVRLRLEVRRFACRVRACPQRTFAETFDGLVAPRVRRTVAATRVLTSIGHALGGEAGARVARTMSVPTSPDTLLRLLRADQRSVRRTPSILGVDDLSLRRRVSYATILVDLESHEVIDLIMGRDGDTLASWLAAHPGVSVVVRDRWGPYAEAAERAIPGVVQVADRFHLVQNASQALADVLQGRRRRIDFTAIPAEIHSDGDQPWIQPRPLSPGQQVIADRRAARVGRWERVHELHASGVSLRQIARDVGLARETVRRLVRTPLPPRNVRTAPPRPGALSSPTLQPYLTYLQDQWQAGCHNVAQLYRELVDQGYTGSASLLRAALAGWRPPRQPRSHRRLRPSHHRFSVRSLCLRPKEKLGAYEQAALEHLFSLEPEIKAAYDLAIRFRKAIADGDVPALDQWLADARASPFPSFVGLANGIARDRAAVDAALTTPWSIGPVEGHIHRVKLIKRQGYGRAKLDLLRRRILAA